MRTSINKKSDFDFIVLDSEGNAIGMPTSDFTLDLWTWGSKCRFRASSIGGVLKGCKNDGGKLRVYVDNPGFVPGKLVGEWITYAASEDYADGSQRTCRYISDFGIDMVDGDSITNEQQVLAMMQYIKGASAYEIACEHGYQGTEEEWLNSLSLESVNAANECRELMAQLSAAEDERNANEQNRNVAEDERSATEQARVTAENNRAKSEADRNAAEKNRATAELNRDFHESTRLTAETQRVSAENERIVNEQSRVASEESRVAAEESRQAAEQARETAEASRIAAESSRDRTHDRLKTAMREYANAESLRDESEAERREAEQYRIEYEQSRQSSEATRLTNERSRTTAENERVINETARSEAESSRATAETARQTAEESRQEAEQGRATAEQARADAEAARAEEFATFEGKIAAKEDAANKVTSIGADANNTTFPTTRAVLNSIAEVKNIEVTPEMLSESTKQYINASGGGTITNLADDEDLTSVDNVLKLADKDYSPTSYSGMGRVYLRKNMVGGKNILTQEMMTKENTIYIIQYDYDLNGATINVPSGCVLDFQGGSFGNGTLSLNDAQITNRGICCDIANITKDYRYPLSFYLGNTDNATLNTNVVQALLNCGISLIIDYNTIEFDRELFVGTIRITTLGNRKSALNFPNSRGFVWNKQIYSSRNNIENISVNSKGHCFDFCNSGDTNRPRNVFDSIFYNISAVSAEGDCFNSGFDNKGSGGDNLSFSNSFNEVAVKASAGCGFVGQTSNTTEFRNIIDNGCAVSLFHNCAGTFRECNGTFGVSTAFFKLTPKSATMATSVKVLFEDCNIESYKGILFDCPSVLTYINLTMRNCSLYIMPNSDGLIDYYPLNLGVVQNFDFANNITNVYNSGTYASGYALLKCNGANPAISPNTTVTYYDNGGYKHECVQKKYSISEGITKSTFNAETFNNQVNLDVERNLSYGMLIPRVNKIEVSKNTGIYITTAYEVFALTCPTNSDVEGNSYWLYYINVVMFDIPIAHYGYRFMLYNGTSNTTFKIAHNQGYSGRFIVDVGENYMLKPKDHVWVKVVVDENNKYYSYVETNHLAKYYLTGGSRPTKGLYNGKQFFDTTLNKPIWWTGSAWVDATGQEV